MTTFQRFQRNSRSQINSQIKNSEVRSDYTQKKISQLVTFSDKTIIFKYSPTSNSYKSFLKITNLSGYRIHFKVRCNKPSDYLVTPYQQIIQDKGQLTVIFQRNNNKQLQVIFNEKAIMRDKFQIVWGRLSNVPGEVNVLSESRVFPVEIIKDQTDNVGYNADFAETKKIGNFPNNFQDNISSSQKFLGYSASARSLPALNNRQEQQTLLRKNVIIGVCAVSFVLGFILT